MLVELINILYGTHNILKPSFSPVSSLRNLDPGL